ncbi:MAG: DUF4175 family protein [Bacteroidia bacterium]|nr:DUF4175 family protein [Bacteroidia bacterium]
MNTGTNILLAKLDAFIRKYYKNRLIRGGLWVIAGVVSAFLIASLLEYFGHFSTGVRTTLFLGFAAFSLFIIARFVVIPVLKLYKLGQRLDYNQAAEIVGKHFPEIGDKLLNTLQLGAGASDNPLLQAAIEQKTVELKPVPFQNAVDFRSNRKYIKYAAVPLLLLILLAAVNQGFTDSTKRLVQYNTHFERQAPFEFILDMDNLSVLQNSEVELRLRTEGDVVPEEVYVNLGGNNFKMRTNRAGEFSYTIKKITQSIDFNFLADGYSSKSYELNTIAKPTLLGYETYLDYPAYTGVQDEWVKNTSELTVPVGTHISWKLRTQHTDEASFTVDKKKEATTKKGNIFEFAKQILASQRIGIKTTNNEVRRGDSVNYSIQIIPDNYPEIKIDQQSDSADAKRIYLIGKINDDYGFNRLLFHYKFVESANPAKKGTGGKTKIGIDLKQKTQGFYHLFDLNSLTIEPEDKLEYYFEVWDNDGVFGSKSTKTSPQIFAAPSLEEINKTVEKNTEKIKEDLSDSKKDISDLESDISELEKKLTEKKELTWEDKKKINELLDKHKDLEKRIEQVVQENQQNNKTEQDFKQIDQNIMDKQQQIEELFNEVMNDEMKELMEKIEEMMNKNQKPQLMQQLEELKMTDQDVQKQLDRMLEQLKQFQLEKKVDETVEKLKDLAKEQEKLSKQTKEEEGKKNNNEDLKKKQEELTKKFDEVKKDLKDIEKKNQDLEKSLDLDMKKMDAEKNEVDQQQKESKENLNKNKNSKASENQKKAKEEMEKMAKNLEQQMEMAMQEQHMEDYNTLREILDNLIQVSQDQEDLMKSFRETRVYNPKYVQLGQHQKKIRDDAKMIEDSLFALSKRVKQVEHFVNKEIGLVNKHLNKAMYQLGERNTHMVINHQQYVMTSMNNLALMLESSLDQMQQQMKSKPGSGQCSKPGQNKKPGGAKSLRKMQEALQKQLEQMGKQQQQGNKPGSEQFAKAAAKQAAIRKKLAELKRQLDKEGKGQKLGNLGKTEKLMDDLEKDLYNKRLNSDVLKRQQQILTRLLEHEKAERKQEQDNKRKSNEGKDLERSIPPSIEEYLKQKQKEQELLKTLPPDLSPYYKQKVRDYFQEIGQ